MTENNKPQVTASNMVHPHYYTLRSIADSIEVLFPEAADILRGMAKEFK